MDNAQCGSTKPRGRELRQKLSILQWNCRTINRKESFLLDYMQNFPAVDVLMLQSLNVDPKSLPLLEGYYYPPEVGIEDGRTMVATYVSSTLKYTPLTVPKDPVACRLTTCGVAIATKGNGQTNLVNVYYPAGSSQESEVTWLRHLASDTSSWVVAGDFNVSHRLWDPTAPRTDGEHLANTVMDSNLTVLNDGSVTRLGSSKQRNSAIDLTMVAPDLQAAACWETGMDNL